MIMEIGITAGEIWDYLEQSDGECSLEKLMDDIVGPNELILMSLGWLAREGHITMSIQGDDHIIRLIRVATYEQ